MKKLILTGVMALGFGLMSFKSKAKVIKIDSEQILPNNCVEFADEAESMSGGCNDDIYNNAYQFCMEYIDLLSAETDYL